MPYTPSSQTPTFSIIIPTCHRNDDLAKCLERLAPGRQTGGELINEERRKALDLEAAVSGEETIGFTYEVIVTDDGRDSTAQAMIAARFPWARWVEGPKRGPASNRNNGARNANGEWLVFTDDDCMPAPDWLAAYAASLQGYEVLEGRTRAYGLRTRLDEECPTNEYGGYLWSCNFAINSLLYEKLGGFDERFPAPAMEDVEFHTRIRKLGLRPKFIQDALVLHPWRLEKNIKFRRRLAQSIHYFVELHPETKSKFSLATNSRNLVRFFVKSFLPGLRTYSGRGCFRSLGLRISHIFFMHQKFLAHRCR